MSSPGLPVPHPWAMGFEELNTWFVRIGTLGTLTVQGAQAILADPPEWPAVAPGETWTDLNVPVDPNRARLWYSTVDDARTTLGALMFQRLLEALPEGSAMGVVPYSQSGNRSLHFNLPKATGESLVRIEPHYFWSASGPNREVLLHLAPMIHRWSELVLYDLSSPHGLPRLGVWACKAMDKRGPWSQEDGVQGVGLANILCPEHESARVKWLLEQSLASSPQSLRPRVRM
jgi:hypothetical protein